MSLSDLDDQYQDSEAETGGGEYDQLPIGVYTATVDRVELQHSKHKNTPCLVLTLNVTDGPHAGRKIFWENYLTTGTISRVKGMVEGLGVTLDRLSDLEQPHCRELFLDIPVEVKIAYKSEEYQGTTRQRQQVYFRQRLDAPPSQMDEPPPQATPPNKQSPANHPDW